MIRIGFDPMLEAQQRQQEIIKAVEQYRMIDEALGVEKSQPTAGYRFLALIGSKIASLGTGLEKRFGGGTQPEGDFTSQVGADGCQ